MLTDLVADGVALNAILSLRFVEKQLGSMSATEMMGSLKERGEAVNRGDLAASERLLYAQAVTLNAIFAELAARSQANMGSNIDAMDRLMRLALKAQGQCRATLETLSTIKNPPVVFARQANIANGPQQVNNGAAPSQAPTHTTKSVSEPNELLEDRTHGSPTLDPRATAAASREDQRLEPVGAVNRPAHGRRQGRRGA